HVMFEDRFCLEGALLRCILESLPMSAKELNICDISFALDHDDSWVNVAKSRGIRVTFWRVVQPTMLFYYPTANDFLD
ncbi:hypothetical protein HDU76_011577, partial [Blyttiomyces sp. JEL0837]